MHLSGKETVICRVGSLEIIYVNLFPVQYVICRVGSLEKHYKELIKQLSVICRVGSLEKKVITVAFLI